jgi:hypothetical protein
MLKLALTEFINDVKKKIRKLNILFFFLKLLCTNRFASQKGMTSMGAVRHICDIRADQFDPESSKDINLQSGTNKFDSQAGMRGFGAIRHMLSLQSVRPPITHYHKK